MMTIYQLLFIILTFFLLGGVVGASLWAHGYFNFAITLDGACLVLWVFTAIMAAIKS